MKLAAAAKIAPISLALVALGVVLGWTWTPAKISPTVSRVPGADRAGQIIVAPAPIDLRGTFVKGPGQASDHPHPTPLPSWSRFRGERFDNISDEPLLLPTWGRSGPTRLWTIDVGEGYAGPAVRNGRAYLLDYDAVQQRDVLRCLSLADGRDIWDRSYPVDLKRNHGMSRTVPAVTDRYVVTMGPKCDVLCVDSMTGDYRWGIDLVAEYHTKVPPWYAGQCPLIDDGKAILAPGGDALMMAVDCATGKVLWKTPNPHAWEMTHSSIIPMTFAGQRIYVYCASGGAVGVSPADGSILWQTRAWKVSMATVPSPLQIGDDQIFFSGGYGAGSLMLQVRASDSQWSVNPIYRLPPEVFGAEQQTPILFKGFIYGVIPGGQLVCLDPTDGKPKWNSGAQRFGIGPYLIADGQIFLVNDTGKLTISPATPDGFSPRGTWTVLENGHESWGPLALVGGQLLLRDINRLACLNLLEARHE